MASLVADSGALYAIYDRHDQHHRRVRAVMEHEKGAIIVPTAILAEVDYLLGAKLGIDAELDFLSDILIGVFTLDQLLTEDVSRTSALIKQYRDLDLGLADAAVISTAERLGIARILTVDERHFRAVRSVKGKPFVLLPADS
jgi:predicted nucleic acid-binding protein